MQAAAKIESARRNMLLQQIRPWEVIDERVLAAMEQIPREQFVAESQRGMAFADVALPLAHGETMMEPKLEARMLQALAIHPGERVLEVGTGSGYVTACLTAIGGPLTSIDIHGDFVDAAKTRLAALGRGPVDWRTGDIYDFGSPASGYDAIAVTGSLPVYDERLQAHLAIGGRLFVIVGEAPAMQAMLVTRVDQDAFRQESLFETAVAPLRNARQPERFHF